MHTIQSQLERAFRDAIRSAFDIDADPLISVAQNEKFGDYQSNAAMGLAKQVAEKTGQKTNPRAVAEQIKLKLELGEMAQEITIAGPGFINVRLSPRWLANQLKQIVADQRLGLNKVERPVTIVVDYSGPNIAKQMHVGHLRSTIIGDAIARVLQFLGHEIIRQNHIGDWGTQFGRVVLAMWYAAMSQHFGERQKIDQMAESLRATRDPKEQDRIVGQLADLHRKYILEDPTGEKVFGPHLRALHLDLSELEALYQFVSAVTELPAAKREVVIHARHGERTLADVPRLVTTFIQNPSEPENAQEMTAWKLAVDITLRTCDDIYRRLDVQLAQPELQAQPIVRGESFYKDRLRDVVDELMRKQIAVESEGAVVVPVPGFDAPLIIQKSEKHRGDPASYLYGTTDLAALRFRTLELGARKLIYTHDSRQSQHFSQVFWTARRAGWAEGVDLEYAPFGTMLGEDGKPFKTRSGDTVKLKDLLDEAEDRAFAVVTDKNAELSERQRRQIAHSVGVGAVKYADLSKDRVSDYVFSWERMLALEGNTAPYLQYQHARIKSIFRKGEVRPPRDAALLLESPYETSLAKQLIRIGEVIELVAGELKPHHLSSYLYELSARFSAFYTECPVLKSDEPTRSSRLLLCDLTARTLALGLDLLGIEHPDEM